MFLCISSFQEYSLHSFSCRLHKHGIFVVCVLVNRLNYCPRYSTNLLQLDMSLFSPEDDCKFYAYVTTSCLEGPFSVANVPDWLILCAFMDNEVTTCSEWTLTHIKCWLLSPGYSVAVLSTQSSDYFVAGAPRSNYTGRVVVYDVDSDGNITIVQSQRGEQARIFWSWMQILQTSVFIDTAVNCNAFVLKIPVFFFSMHLESTWTFLCH